MVKIVTWSRLHAGRGDRSHHRDVVQDLRIRNVGAEGVRVGRKPVHCSGSPFD